MTLRCTITKSGYECYRIEGHGEIHYDPHVKIWWLYYKDPWNGPDTYWLLDDSLLSVDNIELYKP